MAAGWALWRSTDFLALSRVCVRAIRPVRISNRSLTVVAAHARVRSVLPDMCRGLYHPGGLRAIDAFFWILHPHSIDYRSVRAAKKLFSIFVYVGVFAFQVWIAERVLVTIFNRQGLGAWKSMINDANIAKLKDHFIICGYGQVGRTVVDQLTRLEIPFVLIETNEGLCRELLNDERAGDPG
jgi:hypothetical protein